MLEPSTDIAFAIMPSNADVCSLETSVPINILFRSGKVAKPLYDYRYSEEWSVRNLMQTVFSEIEKMSSAYKGSNLLILPHLSTAFPLPYNISEHSPLLLLSTDSHNDLDISHLPDVYMFNSLQISYTICPHEDVNDKPTENVFPNADSQRYHLFSGALSKLLQRCQTAVVCPIWWRKTSAYSPRSYLDSWLSCGLDKSVSSLPSNQTFIPVSQVLTSSLWDHPSRNGVQLDDFIRQAIMYDLLMVSFFPLDFIDLAAHLLNDERKPNESPVPYKGIDGLFLVSKINRRCCEFAVQEATNQVGVFSTSKVRAHALALLKGQTELEHGRICPQDELKNYTHVKAPSIDGLGCRRWGNDSLTFVTVSARNPPPWVNVLIGDEGNLPAISIIDSKVAAFIGKFHNGTLERHLFSRKKILQQDNLLHEAHNATELESLIGLANKHVVVLFFGRHCGYTTHGRGALYEFRSVARHFVNHQSLLFVTVDVDSVQLPWSLTVEHIPVIILFPLDRKSNSIVFPQALLSSSDLYSNLINFLRKHTSSTSNSSVPANDAFRLAQHIDVHVARLTSGEVLLGDLIQRLRISLVELSSLIQMHPFKHVASTAAGQLSLRCLLFTRHRLSSQWRRLVEARERLIKERNHAKAVRVHLITR
ncbi:unnamed protein product [Mesocestoides corti]|uniref:Thioredoxin domain-containing protein n=1 Tax=Mesocestoides corti TaxID=53468 RepID=A0A0R3UDV0_MESCO|nr:unnamed protein product [Mesocestoides corti]